ncbi:MAG: serine hydrolase [Pseudomonadota bacterium]
MDIMRGTPPPPEARVTLDNWDSPPFNRWAFCHVSEVLPTVRVHRGTGPRSSLPIGLKPIEDIRFRDSDGAEIAITDWLEQNFTDGFLVMHRGQIVFERYFNGMPAHALHLSQSVAKSFVCAVGGALSGQGAVEVDAPLESFIPELADCGYAGASLRHVMDMQTGVDFIEDYLDPDSHVAIIDRVGGWKPRRTDDPDTMLDLVLRLKQTRPHGEYWEYRSIETDIAAMCLERATGERLADLVSRLIWDPLGAEEDANFTVDRAGYAMGCGGFNATLRDYARFGQMLTEGGSFNGNQVLPEAFVSESRQGDPTKFRDYPALPNGAYRNGFWIEDVDTGVLMCRGIFGQLIYSDPANDLTAVHLATWPEPQSERRGAELRAAIHAIKDWLRTA